MKPPSRVDGARSEVKSGRKAGRGYTAALSLRAERRDRQRRLTGDPFCAEFASSCYQAAAAEAAFLKYSSVLIAVRGLCEWARDHRGGNPRSLERRNCFWYHSTGERVVRSTTCRPVAAQEL